MKQGWAPYPPPSFFFKGCEVPENRTFCNGKKKVKEAELGQSANGLI